MKYVVRYDGRTYFDLPTYGVKIVASPIREWTEECHGSHYFTIDRLMFIDEDGKEKETREYLIHDTQTEAVLKVIDGLEDDIEKLLMAARRLATMRDGFVKQLAGEPDAVSADDAGTEPQSQPMPPEDQFAANLLALKGTVDPNLDLDF